MQNLPFLESKNAMTQNVLSPKSGFVTQKTNESGTSFKQVLSQQVAHEPSKTEAAKEPTTKIKNQKTTAKSNESNSTQSTGDKADEDNTLLATEVKPVDADIKSKDDKLSKESSDDGASAKTSEETNAALIASLQLPATSTNFSMSSVPLNAQAATGSANATGLRTGRGADTQSAISLDHTQKPVSIADEKVAALNKEVSDSPVVDAGVQTNPKFVSALNEASLAKTLKEATSKSTLESTLIQTAAPISAVVSQATTQLNAMQMEAGNTNFINAYPGKAGWDQAISQKVVWMVGAAEQSATLTLNPPDLGPLQVVINVNNDKADTTFISDNPEVRKALENGISTLRGLMDQAGVQLGQANVNTGRQQQEFQQAAKERLSQQPFVNSSSQSAETMTATRTITRVNNGLVDTFA